MYRVSSHSGDTLRTVIGKGDVRARGTGDDWTPSPSFWCRVPLPDREKRCILVPVDRLPGGSSGVDPPVPIPNTVVKRPSADDTALVTEWENRSPPGGMLAGIIF